MSNDAALQRRRVFQQPAPCPRSQLWVSPLTVINSSPFALASFEQALDGGADGAIGALDQRLPRPGQLPLGAAALLSPLGARWIASRHLELILVLGHFAHIFLVGVGHCYFIIIEELSNCASGLLLLL